jgi:hypothetical protein
VKSRFKKLSIDLYHIFGGQKGGNHKNTTFWFEYL